MPEYYIRNEVGGSTVVKIEAKDKDKALLLAAAMVIEDWENAGSLRYNDVRQEVIEPTYGFDASIYEAEDGHYEFASDDPNGRGEIEEED